MLKIDPENYKSKNVIYEKAKILEVINKLRKEGKKIGLCTGSFDLLHPGHIMHLISAKKMCDVLIVGLAKDSHSLNKNVGRGRPIFSEKIRAFMISKLKPVDFVIFDDCFEDPSKYLINFIKPDVYIKGKDYIDSKDPGIINHKKIVESYGGKIIFTDDEKLSTTEIIKHIKEEVK